ncbi:Gfo/Idh/MocA family protein [Limobrevibacterium gyesilva]|uniref:Gfo/Idh/MocA family oxidoreductase n=1 Tax=Limobrevibacterium gyesilva TaxID=2991712 RepID=A0AA42CGK1_9PROT|nr:Gfo/Idh/MocA family oxidoreductase [Limobrevibacterium gyesilva]MCW3474077.1 Gfo/Idh/MocA family oxidoreductase [Limobrevibacterium gyesilva]
MMRIGWIGCGTHAGEMLLPQLVRLPVRLAALADIDAQRLATIADRYGVAARFADGHAMIEAGGLDAVGIAVGPKQHAELAAAALRRGLPVFIEKPPAATSADAQALADLAAQVGKPCVVGFMKRYSTANRIAGNILRDAAFGPRASLLGEYMTAPTYFVGNPDYTGFLLHHCVHAMDLVPWLMREDVATVHARSHQIEPGKLLLHVGFGFASGALATVVMGTHQSRGTPMEWWQVMGDHKRVEVRNVHEVRFYRAPPFKAADPAATLDPTTDTLVWEPNLTAAANEDHKGYHGLLAAFVRAVQGEPNDAPDIADGARAMRVLEAMMRSMESGAVEPIATR